MSLSPVGSSDELTAGRRSGQVASTHKGRGWLGRGWMGRIWEKVEQKRERDGHVKQTRKKGERRKPVQILGRKREIRMAEKRLKNWRE